MNISKTSISVLVAFGLCALSPKANAEGNPNPRVLPVESNPHGMSYGEWGAKWWQWALGQPADANALGDQTGEFCDVDQSGSVWFLAGTLGGDAERWCTIPTGQSIFFPVVNIVSGAAVGDCEPTNPDVECDFDELLAAAQGAMDFAEPENGGTLEVVIDGVPLEDVNSYRAHSPEPFAITLPENPIPDAPAGTYFPHATDGFWVFLPPLPPGEHSIVFSASIPGFDFSVSVEYHLTIEPGLQPQP